MLLKLQYLLTNEEVRSLPFDEKYKVENAKKELEFEINTLLYAYSTLKVINLYTHFQKLLREIPLGKEKENHQMKCLITFYVLLAQIRYDISNHEPDFSLFSITYPDYQNQIEEIKKYTLFLQKKYNLDDNFKNIFEKQS